MTITLKVTITYFIITICLTPARFIDRDGFLNETNKYSKKNKPDLFTCLIWINIFFGIYQLFLGEFISELAVGRSGEKLFRKFLLDPIPESVSILHSQDDGLLQDYILLHFTISPEDFDRILVSKEWEKPSHSYFSNANHPSTPWWNLSPLDADGSQYQIGIKYDGHKRFEIIWVNSQKTEVYFEVTFIH